MEFSDKSFLDKRTRHEMIKNLYNSVEYNGTFWVIGCGSIGTALIYMLLKIIKITSKNIIVIDKNNSISEKIKKYLDKSNNEPIKFINSNIIKENYQQILKDVKKDDIIIDCSYNINTGDMLKLCEEKGCSYINSSIEDWDSNETDPIKYSLMYKHMELNKINESISDKKSNFIISMGCNPGNVSIWTKFCLFVLNKSKGYTYNSFGELAKKLGVNVIHISEKDTQITNDPKKNNEYCNTWSSTAESMYVEAIGPVEASWGTHEKVIPDDIVIDPKENNFLVLNRRGISTQAVSYTPISKNYIGYIIRHDESFSIGNELSYYENNQLVYKPSVYYVYHPSDSTVMSFYELKEMDLKYQDKCRLLTKDIISGRDELGLTVFLNDGSIYWIGSLLDIEEAREIYDNKFNDNINATIVQVIGGFMSGIIYIIELINKGDYKGLICPDDLPFDKMLKTSMPFFGDFIMTRVNDWDYKKKYNKYFTNENKKSDNLWQFVDFLVENN